MESKDNFIPSSSSKILNEGYNQTYIILSENLSPHSDGHEVLFRCGNWCYRGLVQFNGLEINTEQLPILIPTLQRQQGSLRYYCTSKSVPKESPFLSPINFLEDSVEFLISQITSETIEEELLNQSKLYPWITANESKNYFELVLNDIPTCLKDIKLICNKTYTRNLIIISIYFNGSIYCMLQEGEGDQPLLDVQFPNLSSHGQGVTLWINELNFSEYSSKKNDIIRKHRDNSDRDLELGMRYNDRGEDREADRNFYDDHVEDVYPYLKKLFLWNIIDKNSENIFNIKDIYKIKTLNISSTNYEQTYCILKSSSESRVFSSSAAMEASERDQLSVYHDCLFRFGSWCYSGRVQLIPTLSLQDVPYVIPALRMQQNRLDYYCDVNSVPTTSPFASTLKYIKRLIPLLEYHLIKSETTLNDLLKMLSTKGLSDVANKWIGEDSDGTKAFYEFQLNPSIISD